MKVAFVIGHNKNSKGAYSKELGFSEWDYWNDFYINELCNLGELFNHSLSSSYTSRQKAMADITKYYDLVFELHFNAGSSSANGVEALIYSGNNKMKIISELYCKLMNEKFSLKNRGCKEKSSGNGFGFLKHTKGDAILLEPFFGSNKSDCKKYKHKEHALIIEEVINKYKQL